MFCSSQWISWSGPISGGKWGMGDGRDPDGALRRGPSVSVEPGRLPVYLIGPEMDESRMANH